LDLRFLIKEYEKDRFGESNFSNWNMIDELDNHEDEPEQVVNANP
jgi:hypothetical protein